MERWFRESSDSRCALRGRACPKLAEESPAATRLSLEVGHAIPYQLDGNGQDQKAKESVAGADCTRSKPPYQRPAEAEKERDGQGYGGDAYNHAKVSGSVIHMSSQGHDDADGSRAGHERHGQRGEGNILFVGSFV